MRDMRPEDIGGKQGVEHVLTYHDGSSRNIFVVDEEEPFPEGKLIVSRTDPNGIITQANQAFVEMSGFLAEELIGAPHHILRHPDMPSVAFAALWADLAQGKKWSGYVKNLRKDGRYYWVYATVVSNIRNGVVVGYTSVRRKPSPTKVSEAAKLYKTLR